MVRVAKYVFDISMTMLKPNANLIFKIKIKYMFME